MNPASTSRANRPTRASRPDGRNRGVVRAAIPARQLEWVERLADEPQVALLAGARDRLPEPLERQLPGRDGDLR